MADCPYGIGGVAYLKVDGEQVALRGALTISFFPFERTGVAGMDGVHGYTQAPRAPTMTADLTDIGGLSLTKLQSICNSTITAELLNGKTYVLANAWVSGTPELDATDGTVSVTFEGMTGREMMA